jgi:hypothetical protein
MKKKGRRRLQSKGAGYGCRSGGRSVACVVVVVGSGLKRGKRRVRGWSKPAAEIDEGWVAEMGASVARQGREEEADDDGGGGGGGGGGGSAHGLAEFAAAAALGNYYEREEVGWEADGWTSS